MFMRPSPDSDPLAAKPASYGLHRYLQGSANLFEENRLLKAAIAGLFGVSAVLGAVIYSTNQNARTVVVPFGAGGDLYITGNKPSEAYIRTMTRDIIALSGTWSTYSADRQFQELLSIVHPSAYNAMRDSLNRVLDELANNPTLSIATYILPPMFITSAVLDFPENRASPVAAHVVFRTSAGVPVTMELDWLQTGPQSWDIVAETDKGRMELSSGGAKLAIDGRPLQDEPEAEYPMLYRRFAEIVRAGISDVDLAPLQHVADAFMLGKRNVVEAFFD